MGLKIKNLYKLISKEDSTNIHKILGVSSLLHFIYQFGYLFINGNMNLIDNPYTPLLMSVHGSLVMSSFIFHVPLNRHKGLPMIYKESRLHTIVFSLRSVACALAFYYKLDLIYNILFINLTMLLADLATSKYKAATKTMRGMPFGKDISEEDKKTVTRMHSTQQFAATMFMVGNINSAFSPLLAIQIAAFLMTLVRKAIIVELDWHRVYAITLWLNIFVYKTFTNFSDSLFTILGICLYDYFRIKKGINKYIVWNAIFSIIYLYNKLDYFNDFGIVDEIYQRYFVNAVIVYYLTKNIYITRALWI
jgi:hypothetical protein